MRSSNHTIARTRTALRRTGVIVAFVIGASILPALSANAASSDQTLTLYNGQHEQMTRLLVQAFEKKTGIDVKVRSGHGAELANQIFKEGKRSPADVFFTENSPALMRLQQKGRLAKVDTKTLKQVPKRYSSAKGRWLGVLARQNVMVYNPNKIDKPDLPKKLMDLADDAYQGKVAVSPAEGDFLPLVKAMAVKHGKHKTLQWLKGLKQNAKLYNEDEAIATAVSNGSASLGDINNYYYYRVRQQMGKDAMQAKIAHFEDGNVGNLVNVSGMAVLKSAPNPKAAQKFLAFAVSQDAQSMLAKSEVDFEYPLRPDVAANDALEPFDQLNPPKITVEQLDDNSLALKLVRKAGLL